MDYNEQLRQWVEGDSIHRGEKADPGSSCCPDFSCCHPEWKQPKEVREAFAVADEGQRMRFLGQFLGIAMENHYKDKEEAKKVYIAGVPDTSNKE